MSCAPREPGSHRLLRVELRPLAERRLLSVALPAAPLARLLRTPLRDGRGERDLLPAAEARGGRQLGRDDPSALSLRREDEPVRHPCPPLAGGRGRRAEVLRANRAARALAEARSGALAAAGELP